MTISITISIIAVFVSVVSVFSGIYFNSKNSKHTDTKDTEQQMKEKIEEIEERTRERTELNVKLGYITQNTQDIKEQINSLMRDVQKHGDRLTVVEGAINHTNDYLNKLHARIDSLEERVSRVERDDED